MRALSLFLILILSSTRLCAQPWVKLSDFPGSIRDDGVAVVIGDKAYIGSGLDPVSETIDFKVLQLSTQQWSSIPNMPMATERQYACAFANDTCFYVSGGLSKGLVLTSMYRYSVAQQSWRLAAPKPGKGVLGASIFQFGEKIILAGGKDQSDAINYEVWEYDVAANSWQQKNRLPFAPVWRGSSATLNGYGYLFGGIDSSSRFSKKLYRYTPSLDQWTHYDSLPLPYGRAYSAMQALNNRLFIFAGYDSLQTYYNDAWIYAPQTKQWIPAPALPAAARKGGMSFGNGQQFFYTCGLLSNGMRLKETWVTEVPTSIAGEEVSLGMYCYPNPTEDFLYLSHEIPEESRFELYSLQGELLHTFAIKGLKSIDLRHLNSGLYILRLLIENKVHFYKIQKS